MSLDRLLQFVEFSHRSEHVSEGQSHVGYSQWVEATTQYIIEHLVVKTFQGVPFEHVLSPVLITFEKLVDVVILWVDFPCEICKILFGFFTVCATIKVM